ncbi:MULTISPECIES: low temperature requirement protein A [Nostoc]|uniref:Low temperature requirement protein A n=1 Tax=Nostoc paludosum FACHB-159 TaxID=2692908 RepID=A0ABR8K585_9NOSO|nr:MULTISPECIES: low temperature requirement protein A [Nostoc]MBD2678582.1 low temperature requirement protein A [Nostoc sp. FACHB-857]MBD2734629.1 low temperature requirement protein A [Nostoc paludosum FACHB-159]
MTNFIQPPRLRIGEETEEERRATWLELFYDLVFVVAVSQLAHNLKEDISLSGLFGFIVLFIPVWWSWIGTTFYANRFDSDDVGHRLLIAIQMLTAAAMAVNIHHGLGESSPGFALSYALGRTVLVIEYVRAGIHIPSARPLTTRYAIGFAIAALLWLISAFIPIPWRFALWTLGIIIDFATPLTGRKFQLGLLPHASHLPERFGLFTIIVLGEAIIAVVNGVSEQKWNTLTVISAVFGLVIAFSWWWVYFDNLGGKPIEIARTDGKVGVVNLWLYTHLPLVIGIAAAGVGVEQILLSKPTLALPDSHRWLICGSVALCSLAVSILHRFGVIRYCKIRSKYRLAGAVVLMAIAIFGKGLLPIAVITLVALVSALQVIQDLYQSRPTTRLADPEI